MPDITDSILQKLTEEANYLPPSTQDVLTYADTLIAEGNQLDFNWAHSEIKLHTLNWVRVGLVAYRVRLYRLYRNKFQRFQDYCEEGLGRSLYQIKNLIKASAVVIELARAGFETLPHCMAQAMKLHRYLESGELIEKWEQVLNSVPAHLITAFKIDEALDHELPKKTNLRVPRHLRDRLDKIALNRGVSIDEVLEDLMDGYEGMPEEDSEVDEIPKHKIEIWEQDLETLISEYEIQQFLWCSLVRLIRKNRSDFSPIVNLEASTA